MMTTSIKAKHWNGKQTSFNKSGVSELKKGEYKWISLNKIGSTIVSMQDIVYGHIQFLELKQPLSFTKVHLVRILELSLGIKFTFPSGSV